MTEKLLVLETERNHLKKCHQRTRNFTESFARKKKKVERASVELWTLANGTEKRMANF